MIQYIFGGRLAENSGRNVQMAELGEILRQAREAKGLSLAQVEEATKIRSAYLQALEEGEYDLLPAAVYVKGFLKNYAQYLGMDPQEVLSLYQEPGGVTAATSVPRLLDEPLEPVTLRRWWPLGFLLLAIAALAIGWWGYQRYYGATPFMRPTATPTTHPTSTATVAEVSPTTLTATATRVPTETFAPTPTRTLTPTPVGLELSIEVVGSRSWVLVIADGERVFAGILEPGATDTWTARERISLRSGNAGAVRVTLNGEDMGLFGEAGEVVETEWTAPNVPTRTPTPTSSA
jgi:cytoskeleton protein RodZ